MVHPNMGWKNQNFKINLYNFVQVIPAEVDHIDFTWEARKGSAVPYKITFMHAPSKAMDNPSVNISTEGIVPTHTDKFRLFFPCTGKVAEQVETLFQVQNLNFIFTALFLCKQNLRCFQFNIFVEHYHIKFNKEKKDKKYFFHDFFFHQFPFDLAH